jgi:hypothetical protein
MTWTTVAEEASLLEALSNSPRVAIDIIGQSVEGRPIRLLRIGAPPPPSTQRATLLLVGAQHGDEPAGREALLQFAEYLSTTNDNDEVEFLATHGALIIPTVNPDGIFWGTRHNAVDVNLNRDYVPLAQPETRAVATILGRVRPLLLVDHHEALTGIGDTDHIVEFAHSPNPQIHADVSTEAAAVITAMKARATTESWDHGDYPSPGGALETALHPNVALRHGAGVLVETYRGDDTESGQGLRTEVQYGMAEEALAYAIANAGDLLTMAETAAADVAAEGVAGVVAFDLRTETVDPPPLGYGTSVSLLNDASFHLRVYNISRSGPGGFTLHMGQPAQTLIPYIFDAEAEFSPFAATRLFALPQTSDAPATVQDFAPVVSGSHTPMFEARILTEFQTGFDPVGDIIDEIDGDVIYDSTAKAFGTLNLIVPGVDPKTNQSRFPRLPDDILMPYGTEVFVRRGVDLGAAGVLWSPLGYFLVESVEQDGDSEAPVVISGRDRMGPLIDWDVAIPREFAADVTVSTFMASLVNDFYPDAIINFDDESEFQPLGRTIIVDETRYEAMKEVVDGLGKVMYWDGEGTLQIETAPDADDKAEPIWFVNAGKNGVAMRINRRISALGAPNGVIIHGEGGTGDPVSGIAVDLGPKSPTRWGRPGVGQRPIRETLPTVTTQGQAQVAAAERLRRLLGVPYSADFGAVANPALRPRMPGLVRHHDGNRDRHVTEMLVIPLSVGGEMSGTTRERTHIVIGSQIGLLS